MDYATSYRHVEAITATGATTYSDWFDVSWANEIYSFLTFAESGAGNSESILVTLERYVPYVTPTATTVLTHSAATAAANEEKYGGWMTDAAAPGAENKLGMRVRWKFVSSGTWTVAGNTITITMILHAKRN